MTLASLDLSATLTILAGAFVAGFTTGFAGFGTGLVSAGFWFHALPAAMVPPLIALVSVAGQLVGVVTVRKAFEWSRVTPFLIGGVLGVPIGVAALAAASPGLLKTFVGVFLVAYAVSQLSGLGRAAIGDWGGRGADTAVGVGGGILGGFAGLSGPLPLIWLQLRGGPSDRQRATYQPFNLIVLSTAALVMAASGQLDLAVLAVAAICLPVTLAGAWIGARVYVGVSETAFRRTVLVLLLASGTALIIQMMT